jgi:hypothetical protein
MPDTELRSAFPRCVATGAGLSDFRLQTKDLARHQLAVTISASTGAPQAPPPRRHGAEGRRQFRPPPRAADQLELRD